MDAPGWVAGPVGDGRGSPLPGGVVEGHWGMAWPPGTARTGSASHPSGGPLIPSATVQAAGRAASAFPLQITVAILAGSFSLIVLVLNMWVSGQRDRDSRRRDTYAKAFSAVVAYKEFPYVVRRRRGGDIVAGEERVRISEDLRHVQEQLSYYSAWMA